MLQGCNNYVVILVALNALLRHICGENYLILACRRIKLQKLVFNRVIMDSMEMTAYDARAYIHFHQLIA